MSTKTYILFYGIVFTLLIGFLFGVGWIKAGFEARTFNKFSAQKADTWDALFADLRVEACRQNP